MRLCRASLALYQLVALPHVEVPPSPQGQQNDKTKVMSWINTVMNEDWFFIFVIVWYKYNKTVYIQNAMI